MAKQKMSTAISNLITEREKQGDLFKILKKVLDDDNQKILPNHCNPTKLANDFNSFFLSKVENIRNSVPYNTQPYMLDINDTPIFSEFTPTSVNNVSTVLQDSEQYNQ